MQPIQFYQLDTFLHHSHDFGKVWDRHSGNVPPSGFEVAFNRAGNFTTCLLKGPNGTIFVGPTKRNPIVDDDDPQIGKLLALSRATQEAFPLKVENR